MTAAPDDVLLVQRPAPEVRCLLLNRPERRNALDRELVAALHAAITEPGEARVLVLASAAPGVFSAGADLKLADDERAIVSDELYGLYEAMLACPLPIVAAIDGPAVGGGAQLAIASDLRIASARARLRFAGAGHGLAVGAWGLPTLVGRGRAALLCLTMRDVEGEEAAAIGLVDVLADDPLATAIALARDLCGLDPSATTRVKRGIAAAVGLHEALVAERSGNAPWDGAVPSTTP